MATFDLIPNWEKIKERFCAFWENEIVDRCCMALYAAKSDAGQYPPPATPSKVTDRWDNFDYMTAANEHRFKTTHYGAEAFPVWHAGFAGGWDWMVTHLKCPWRPAEDTAWVDPILTEGELTDYDYNDYVIEDDDLMWLMSKRIHTFNAQSARGRVIAGTGALGGCGDNLAAMRGNENLLIDLIECPEYVAAFDRHLYLQWKKVYEWIYQLMREQNDGSVCGWFPLWSPGRFYPLHNDFAYMISPKMFRQIFLPNLAEQAEYLDHTCYHVDGEGNFNHIEALLEVPKIQCLQVLPGAGKPGQLSYIKYLRRIQEAGHSIHLYISGDEVEDACRLLSSRGMFLDVQCSSVEQAEYIEKNAHRWTRERI